MLPIQKAVQMLKAVRVCVCTQPCEWHGNPHAWYAFKGDSGSYYILHHDKMVFVPGTRCLQSLEPYRMVDGWHPYKVRTLTVHGVEKDVCARCGIIDLGKFELEQMHTVRDYDQPDEVHSDGYGSYSVWRTGHRFYVENADGFVSEITKESFDQHVKELDREEEIVF